MKARGDASKNENNGMNFFGEPLQELNILVFHDESGDYGHSGWVFTGLLWIRDGQLEEIGRVLKSERLREDYDGEIHFSQLPESFNGEYGAKARVARRWFGIWKGEWAYRTWLNILAINRRHTSYDHRRFTRGFHAYNRFTAMALKGGLAWHFSDVNSLGLRIFSDEKARRPQGIVGDGIITDNFEQYLEMRLEKDTQRYRGPKVNLDGPVICLSCPRKGPFKAEEEVMQLIDVLLGSVVAAVEGKSRRRTKMWFGKQISTLLEDVRLEPWRQTFGLHKRLSIGYFPSRNGQIYGDGPLKSTRTENQLRLL